MTFLICEVYTNERNHLLQRYPNSAHGIVAGEQGRPPSIGVTELIPCH